MPSQTLRIPFASTLSFPFLSSTEAPQPPKFFCFLLLIRNDNILIIWVVICWLEGRPRDISFSSFALVDRLLFPSSLCLHPFFII